MYFYLHQVLTATLILYQKTKVMRNCLDHGANHFHDPNTMDTTEINIYSLNHPLEVPVGASSKHINKWPMKNP